jgi:hypothetical protein
VILLAGDPNTTPPLVLCPNLILGLRSIC